METLIQNISILRIQENKCFKELVDTEKSFYYSQNIKHAFFSKSF